MAEPARVDLVCKALTSGLSNCVEWVSDTVMLRVREDPGNQGLSPGDITKLLIAFVKQGGRVEERVETREEWKQRRDYWYRAVLPLEGFARGLFIELELRDDDLDVPMVTILNAHRQEG